MDADILLFELEAGESWTDLSLVSFVDDPAIKRQFLKFSGDTHPFRFSADKDRMIVTGPVLIPDLIIPRRIQTEKGPALIKVVFRSEQVETIYTKAMEAGALGKTNLMHAKEEHDPESCFLLEAFLSDQQRGIRAPQGFEDLPDRTIFASYKIKSPALWARISSGDIQGFSLEGQFRMKISEEQAEESILRKAEELLELLKKS